MGRLLIGIAFAALGIRIVFLVLTQPYLVADDWSFGYEAGRVAASLASGEGFSSPFQEPTGPTAWLAPAFPLLMAAIFKIFGTYSTNAAIALLSINCAVSAATCFPVYGLARRVCSSRRMGLAAAGALAIYPPSIWHAVNTIWDTTIFTFFALLVVLGAFKLSDGVSVKRAVLLGVMAGLAVMFNPVILAFLGLALPLIILKSPEKVSATKACLVVCLMVGLIATPWVLRNKLVMGSASLRSNFGVEFKLGNSAETWGAIDEIHKHNIWLRSHPTNSKAELYSLRELGEVNYARICFDKARDFIIEHPRKFIHLTAIRISIFWFGDVFGVNEWVGNLKGSIVEYMNLSLMKKLFYILPILFAIIGVWFSFRKKYDIWIPLLYILASPLVYYITHVNQRYRFPMEPVILIFSLCGIYALWLGVKSLVLRRSNFA